MITIEMLMELLASGQFHHATYRNQGTIWEGLWIYQKSETGFRGFEAVGFFGRQTAHLEQAEQLVSHTGVSLGSYGRDRAYDLAAGIRDQFTQDEQE